MAKWNFERDTSFTCYCNSKEHIHYVMKNFDFFFSPPENSTEVNPRWDSLSYILNLFHTNVPPLCLDNLFTAEIPRFTLGLP